MKFNILNYLGGGYSAFTNTKAEITKGINTRGTVHKK